MFKDYNHLILVFICIYFSFETLMALLSMIFLRPNIPEAISYARNLLCLFLNYMQFVFFFAILYLKFGSGCLFGNEPSRLKAIYLSLEVFTTVGFGDFHGCERSDYIILIIQMIVLLIFVYIIFTLFVSRIGKRTFYNYEKNKSTEPSIPIKSRNKPHQT